MSASCLSSTKCFTKNKNCHWSSFSFPLITCMRHSSCVRSSLLLFSHCCYKSSRTLYFPHFILFAAFNNLSGLYFGYRFLLDFCMLELLISSGLRNAGRSYSQCYLRSANHSRESKSDPRVQMEKHWSEV